MASLTTFRGEDGIISDDPSGRSDGDTTTWDYSWAENLPLRKTYADGSSLFMEYGDMNQLRKVTNARGQITEYTYESCTGKLLSSKYSDSETPDVSYIYNHLGWLTQVSDGSGVRRFSYDHYGNISLDALPLNAIEFGLQLSYDSFGRLENYYLVKDGSNTLFSASHSFWNDGRLDAVEVLANGNNHAYKFGYVPGSNLLQEITMPGGLSKVVNYENNRDMEIGIRVTNAFGDNLVSRSYINDPEGIMIEREQYRNGEIKESHLFDYNDRSELSRALIRGVSHGFQYDNAGNREQETVDSLFIQYDTNSLNQYGKIESSENLFIPTYDADGNQTKVKTSSGIWNVVYNSENRPVCFISENGQTVVKCDYDYRGRRHSKKVIRNGIVTVHENYLYMGYLQLAALDMKADERVLHLLLWDPSSPESTRTLALVQNGQVYSCIHDLTKNVTELLDSNGNIVATYDYSPFGEVMASGTVNSPVQWSNEVYDTELGLVYYNYRHYNPIEGRWISRDFAEEEFEDHSSVSLYHFSANNPLYYIDMLGLGIDSVDASLAKAIARNDIEEIKSILEISKCVMKPQSIARAERALQRLTQTAEKTISQTKKASIRKEFPSEYLKSTGKQIQEAADQGVKAAQKANKLLKEDRFNK